MPKCPYCFEEVNEKTERCSHCQQFIIEDLVRVDYPSVDKKRCIFCGKNVLVEARVCKHCQKWFDELQNNLEDVP